MEHGHDIHHIVGDDEEDPVGKPTHEGPADVLVHDGIQERVVGDESERAIDLVDELIPDGPCVFPGPPKGFREIGFRLGADAQKAAQSPAVRRPRTSDQGDPTWGSL